MKRLVVSALGNRIYSANIKKDGTIGAKEDVTDNAIATVFEQLLCSIPKGEKGIEIRFEERKGYVLKMMKE